MQALSTPFQRCAHAGAAAWLSSMLGAGGLQHAGQG